MTYASIIRKLPQDIQYPMLELIETLQRDMREQYAVRRQDFEALSAAVAELAQAQKRSEERLTRLERVVEELAQAQKRTEEVVQKLVMRVGKNTGKLLELDHRDKAYAYFGSLLRKVKVVSLQELEPALEEHLSEAEFNALLPLDLLVEGQVRTGAALTDKVYVAVEVSAVIDENDVKRAQERAALLRKAGFRVVPAVAGEDVTEGASLAAQEAAVLLVQNGTKQNWERALAAA